MCNLDLTLTELDELLRNRSGVEPVITNYEFNGLYNDTIELNVRVVCLLPTPEQDESPDKAYNRAMEFLKQDA